MKALFSLFFVAGLMIAQQSPYMHPSVRHDDRQCCECCFDQAKRSCIPIMETNKCRERGGFCNGTTVPCFGRD